MFSRILLGLLPLAVAGCQASYIGPPQLAGCLQDQRIMAAYRDFSQRDPERVLIGGISKTEDRVNCFWGGGAYGSDLFASPVYKSCRETSSSCTLLARGPEVK